MKPGSISFIYLIMSLGLIGCDRGVPIVGLDHEGKFRSFNIYEEKFAEHTAELLAEVSSAINRGTAKTNHPEKSWTIHTVSVGVGAAASIDTAPSPIFLSVEPRIRFIFTDKEKPLTP